MQVISDKKLRMEKASPWYTTNELLTYAELTRPKNILTSKKEKSCYPVERQLLPGQSHHDRE